MSPLLGVHIKLSDVSRWDSRGNLNGKIFFFRGDPYPFYLPSHGISRVGLGHHSTSQQGVSVQGAGGPLSPEAVRGALLSGWWSGDRSAAERGRGSPPCMWSHASQLELHSQDFPWC